MSKRSSFVLKIIGSLAVLAGLVWIVDPRQLAHSVASADGLLLTAALGMAVFNRILMSVKWNLLARSVGVFIPWSAAIKAYFASTFAGVFLPPTIGADAVRTVILSRRFGKTAEIIGSILVERLLGLIVLAIFGLIGVAILVQLFAGELPAVRQVAWFIGGGAVALFLGLVFVTTPFFGRLVNSAILRISQKGGFWTRHAGTASQVKAVCGDFKSRKSAVAVFTALTVLENFLVVLRAWLVTIAFGIDIGALLFFVLVPVEQFLIRLPISFDGFGLREGLFLYALSSVGVPDATALAIGLANHLMFIIAVLPGAWFLLFGWGRRGTTELGEPGSAADQS